MRILIVLYFFTTTSLADALVCEKVDSLPKIIFLSPVESGAPFWYEFEEAMKVATKQLCFTLESGAINI